MPIRSLLALLAAGAALAAAPEAAERGEALRASAREGDVAEVRRLLDQGTPPDARSENGATALWFAADTGRLDVVRLLLERGADVNAADAFFKATPLGQALNGGHAVVARLLLERGARDADVALRWAMRRPDLDLARLALATGRVEPLELLAARREAEAGGPGPIRELLEAAPAASPVRPPFAVRPERLAAYGGRYRDGQGGQIIVTVRGDGLVLEAAGQEDVALRAVGEDRFEDEAARVGVQFWGRAELVESMRVNRAGEVARFSPAADDQAPLPAAAAAGPPRAPRTAPRNWPSFRGADASGDGDGQGVPAAWSVPSGERIRFRTPIPGLAVSSPIVWGDRIFVTTAVSARDDRTFRTGIYGDGTAVDDLSEHSFRLYALDKATGRVLWEREAHRGSPLVRRHLKASQASATPATDGRRVVAVFGSIGLLVAYDVDGTRLWERDLGAMDCGDPIHGSVQWGHGSSPIVYRDTVIVQGDRQRDSFLAAYRLEDGAEAWRVPRDEASTWATPTVLRAPSGDELVTNGQTIRGYDPATGRLLWTLGPSSEVVVATPVVGSGLAFVTAGYPPVRPVYAVRPGQRGDLTLPEGRTGSAALAWSHRRGGTYIPTPIVYGGHLYTVNNNGILTCYRAETGERVYQTRLGGAGASFAASPVAADGRLYFASETGEVYVLRAGEAFELLATNDMDEVVMATPAISDGLLVVRTLGHVVGIGEVTVPSPAAGGGPDPPTPRGRFRR